MDQEITYRIATSEDYDLILELYNTMYSINRSVGDFRWLVEDNPAGRAILFVALVAGQAVGMQSLIPYWFIKNGERVFTYKSEDTLVDKAFRGRGVFSMLYKMVHEYAGDNLVWGLTDKREILRRVNMPSRERLAIAIAVKRPSLVTGGQGLQKMFIKTLYYSYLYLKSTFRSTPAKSKYPQSSLGNVDCSSKALKEFFNRLSRSSPTTYFPAMDNSYLEWRLAKNPNLESHHVELSYADDGRVVMCSVVGYTGNSAHWHSFYAEPSVDMADRIGHVYTLRQKIFGKGVLMIHTWLFACNDDVREVRDIFYAAGFSSVREGLWIVHNSEGKAIDVHDLYFSAQLGIR